MHLKISQYSLHTRFWDIFPLRTQAVPQAASLQFKKVEFAVINSPFFASLPNLTQRCPPEKPRSEINLSQRLQVNTQKKFKYWDVELAATVSSEDHVVGNDKSNTDSCGQPWFHQISPLKAQNRSNRSKSVSMLSYSTPRNPARRWQESGFDIF